MTERMRFPTGKELAKALELANRLTELMGSDTVDVCLVEKGKRTYAEAWIERVSLNPAGPHDAPWKSYAEVELMVRRNVLISRGRLRKRIADVEIPMSLCETGAFRLKVTENMQRVTEYGPTITGKLILVEV